MVRQRKDGDSLERVDGSKPTWKVCLGVRVILLRLHVPSVLVFVSYLCSHTQKHSHFCTLVFRIVELSVISGIKENIKYSHL